MRISVPSWVIPGTYAENLGFLAEKREITGVELLFFIYDDETKQMLRDEWDVIESYAGRFTYTVHLPDRILPEHAELVERFLPHVRNFVVHPYPAEGADAERRLLEAWRTAYGYLSGHAGSAAFPASRKYRAGYGYGAFTAYRQ